MKKLLLILLFFTLQIGNLFAQNCEEQLANLLDNIDQSTDLITAISENPDIIDSWKLLDDIGETDLNTRISDIELVDSYIKAQGKSVAEVKTIIEKGGGFSAWKLANSVDDVFIGLVDEIDGVIRISTKEGIEVARGSVNTMTGTNGTAYDVLQMTITTKGTSVTGRQSVQQTIKYMDEVWEQPVEGFLVNWKKVDGLSDNIDGFNKKYLEYLSDGFDEVTSKSKAYFDTFSGKMATEQGFSNLHYINGVKDDSGIFTSIEGLVTQ
jgi:hypothetical protein